MPFKIRALLALGLLGAAFHLTGCDRTAGPTEPDPGISQVRFSEAPGDSTTTQSSSTTQCDGEGAQTDGTGETQECAPSDTTGGG